MSNFSNFKKRKYRDDYQIGDTRGTLTVTSVDTASGTVTFTGDAATDTGRVYGVDAEVALFRELVDQATTTVITPTPLPQYAAQWTAVWQPDFNPYRVWIDEANGRNKYKVNPDLKLCTIEDEDE